MASELRGSGGDFNLSNYYPVQRSFNNVVYVHKRYFTENNKNAEIDENQKAETKEKHNKRKNDKVDKIEQQNQKVPGSHTKKAKTSDGLLQQTIKFAKNIVPLTIPPSRDISPPPVFYTIKTSKKDKSKVHRSKKVHNEPQDACASLKTKQMKETFLKKNIKSHRETVSVHESVSYSYESTTVEDSNRTLSSISEISEQKHLKIEQNIKKRIDKQKFIASESFEAVATELNNTGDPKLKIQLMNDKEKYLFSESIRIPIMNAIKECIVENCVNGYNTELVNIQQFMMCNSQALNGIMEKLLRLEKKVDFIANENYKKYNKELAEAAAKKEAAQIREAKSNVVEGEMCESSFFFDEKMKDENDVITLFSRDGQNDRSESVNNDKMHGVGCGEIPPLQETSNITTEVQPGRSTRLPTRFCWTDAVRN